MSTTPRTLFSLLAVASLVPTASAQFAEEWTYFVRDDGMITESSISNSNHETDLDWDDLDLDGDVDLVVARSIPFMFVGKRRNILMMNEGGVLTNKSLDYAYTSDVPGDNGFFTPTQDRDVVIADIDNDGWPDVITCTDRPQAGDSKAISHPRIYRNLGDDGGGNWQGLGHEDARFPQLLHNTTGLPIAPRFMGVDAGDLNNDGFIDLYFVDQDYTNAFVNEPAGDDTDDRMLVNDGNGFFADVTLASLAPAIASSNYSNSLALADFNLDGTLDRVKQNSHQPGPSIYVAYNDLATPGQFTTNQQAYSGSPYFVNSGDLNQDGRPDLIWSDNGNDRYMLNRGTSGSNQAIWFTPTPYDFLSGGDDSFASNNLVADIDGDGWNDTLHADVDPELSGYNRRLHIYHNLGGTPGALDIVLREERESASNSDWIGVPGMTTTDMQGTHDVAVFDVDGDGSNELIVSRLAGTHVWRQYQAWEDRDCALAGVTGEPELDGTGTLQAGDDCSLVLSNAAPGALCVLFVSAVETPVPFKGGVLKTVPVLLDIALTTNAAGGVTIPFAWPAGFGALTFYAQFAIADAAGPVGASLSNALAGHAP